MKDRVIVCVLAMGGATVFMGLYLALWAMLHQGIVSVNFNAYYEGWIEVGFLSMTLLLYPWAIWGVIKDRS